MTHRHPDAWDDPERFAPERFLGNERHPFSYLPFGGGPRQCLGSHFAFMEAKVIVAMVATRFTLDLARPSPILLQPAITLRCRGGLAMRLSRAEGLEPNRAAFE